MEIWIGYKMKAQCYHKVTWAGVVDLLGPTHLPIGYIFNQSLSCFSLWLMLLPWLLGLTVWFLTVSDLSVLWLVMYLVLVWFAVWFWLSIVDPIYCPTWLYAALSLEIVEITTAGFSAACLPQPCTSQYWVLPGSFAIKRKSNRRKTWPHTFGE